MFLTTSKSLLAILLLLTFISVKAQTFQAEEHIKNRALIPKDVLVILKETKRVKSCFKNVYAKPKTQFSASWFQAAKVNLNNDKLADYVVKANEGCLYGANTTLFWVFRQRRKGFEMVLEVYELAINIGNKKKTNGFYDIGTFSATAVKGIDKLWVFDGKKYKLKQTKVSDL